MKFLIVEDDTALNNGIALSLTGDNAIQSYSIADAEKNFDESIDLIILDINLPDGNGVDFCRKIRKTSQVPIIFLTANDMEIDIVTGLESGADDYITKPFSLAVLRARINTVLRRKQPVSNKYDDDLFSFDFENMLFSANGRPVELSKTEQKLLKILDSAAAAAGKVQRILLQVNAGNDPAKFGADISDAPELLGFALKCPHISVEGLMTIAPLDSDLDVASECFANLRNLRDILQKDFSHPLPELSMGMTGDLERAVAEGATMVRIGTALFGERVYA